MTPRRSAGQVLAFIVLLAVAVGWTGPLAAQPAGGAAGLDAPEMADGAPRDAFTIANVAVDVTDETAAAAKERALAMAQGTAFARLMARLVPREAQPRLPVLKPNQVAELVLSFEIEQEQTSPVRYIAKLRYRFQRDAVRDWLRGAGIPFAESLARPVVIIPVFRQAAVLRLWEASNPWRERWQAAMPRSGLVPMIVPDGALADIRDIGPEQALRGDVARLDAIARRHGADAALVALAHLGVDVATNLPVLHVSASIYGGVLPDRTMVRSFSGEAGETTEALLRAAVEAVIADVEEGWKQENQMRFDRKGEMMVNVRLRNFDHWLDVRRKLADIAFIEATELISLSVEAAELRLRFLGTEAQLRLALAQRDLSLERGPYAWELRARERGALAR